MRYLIFSILFFTAVSCRQDKPSKSAVPVINYLNAPSSENSAQPFLFSSKNQLFLSWTKKENDSVASLYYTSLKDTIWSEPQKIAGGSNWFVNWADFPAIAENNGYLLSYFLQKSADQTYTYDIRMKLFDRDSATWQDDFVLHNDGTQSEHGFVTMIPDKKKGFFVTWLDGRNTAGGHSHHGAGAMTIRAANLSFDGSITNEVEIDAKTCDCCQTSAAMTQNGPIIVYRDRSDNEIRDINVARLVNGQWTKPKPVFQDNWKIEGCPVNGPKVASRNNSLAVAWYTAAKEVPKVKLIFSNDNGATFDNPITIDEIETIGRVDVAFIDEKHVLMTWVASENNQTVLKVAKVNLDGTVDKSFVVAQFDSSRSSGFPQLEILRDKAYLVWTDVSGENPILKTAYLELKNL